MDSLFYFLYININEWHADITSFKLKFFYVIKVFVLIAISLYREVMFGIIKGIVINYSYYVRLSGYIKDIGESDYADS